MKRFLHAVGLAVAVLWLWHGGSAFAVEQRIALVIGNSAYTDSPLANPANDARLMAETLRGLGFDVIERIDADLQTIQLASFELQDRLVAAGKDAVGLFFYAGHGLQVAGENYLVPLGSDIKQEREVAIKAVSASFILQQMEFAENRMNFIILDACRNNPLTRSFRSATRGLARMDAPRGSLVAYSTGPGSVAADGTGVNSPYTMALVEALQTPGIAAEKMFKRVRDSVMAATNGDQTPWEESSLTGADFFFNADTPVAATVAATPATSDSAAATQQETVFWQSIQDSTDPADFEVYLAEYPGGTYAGLARNRLRRLQETQTATLVPAPERSIQVAEMDATFVALRTSNVRAEPTTGSDRIGQLARDETVIVTGKATDENWYRIAYQGGTAYVFGDRIAEIDPGEIAAWETIAGAAEAADFTRFLDDFPDGHFAPRVRSRLAALESTEPAAAEPGAAAEGHGESTEPADNYIKVVYADLDRYGEQYAGLNPGQNGYAKRILKLLEQTEGRLSSSSNKDHASWIEADGRLQALKEDIQNWLQQ